MRKLILLNLLFTGLILTFAFSNAYGQLTEPTPDSGNQLVAPKRPKLLDELDLSKDQLQQIRRINLEHRLLIQESKRRLKQANEDLDKAIYDDNITDAEIQTRLREAQMAYTENLKNQTMQETAIRKVLSPTQLIRFRQLKEEFDAKKRETNQKARQEQAPPPNRLKNLPRRRLLRQQQMQNP